MSFRCQDCGQARPDMTHPDETRPTRVVTKKRPRGDNGGMEIAEEKILCASCTQIRMPTVGSVTFQPKPVRVKKPKVVDPDADSGKRVERS
jgi:hypothetical protein